MSKQSKNKEIQGYTPKPVFRMCSNCKFFASDVTEFNRYGSTYTEEKNIRCAYPDGGDFAVKKQGNCNKHEFDMSKIKL